MLLEPAQLVADVLVVRHQLVDRDVNSVLVLDQEDAQVFVVVLDGVPVRRRFGVVSGVSVGGFVDQRQRRDRGTSDARVMQRRHFVSGFDGDVCAGFDQDHERSDGVELVASDFLVAF